MKYQQTEWVSSNREWAGIMTAFADGSKLLDLHPERRYALTRLNNARIRQQNVRH